MKLSRWYPGTTNPVMKGVYERKLGDIYDFSKWDGVKWRAGCNTVLLAAKERGHTVYSKENFEWRGLAENPKEAK